MTRTKKKHTARSAMIWMRRDLKALGSPMITSPVVPLSAHGAVSRAGSVTAALRVVRKVGTEAEIAAAERAHAELVQALHATIRAAEPAGGAR